MLNNLRVNRAQAAITQEELARRVGVTRQTIHSIETGKYIPSAVLAFKIARVFSRPVEEIFTLEAAD